MAVIILYRHCSLLEKTCYQCTLGKKEQVIAFPSDDASLGLNTSSYSISNSIKGWGYICVNKVVYRQFFALVLLQTFYNIQR